MEQIIGNAAEGMGFSCKFVTPLFTPLERHLIGVVEHQARRIEMLEQEALGRIESVYRYRQQAERLLGRKIERVPMRLLFKTLSLMLESWVVILLAIVEIPSERTKRHPRYRAEKEKARNSERWEN